MSDTRSVEMTTKKRLGRREEGREGGGGGVAKRKMAVPAGTERGKR